MLVGGATLFVFKHSLPPARIWINLIPFGFVLMDAGLTYLTEKLPRGLRSLLPALLVTLGLLYAVFLMSTNAIAERKETLPFWEASFVVRYLEPLMNSDDIVHVGRPGSFAVRFYFWYYGLPKEHGVTRPKLRQEFFIVKKSRYSVSDLTEKPVVKLLDFGDAALYQLLHPEEVRIEERMERTDERLLLVVTKVRPRAAHKHQHNK
jgi:hypothetical protein